MTAFALRVHWDAYPRLSCTELHSDDGCIIGRGWSDAGQPMADAQAVRLLRTSCPGARLLWLDGVEVRPEGARL